MIKNSKLNLFTPPNELNKVSRQNHTGNPIKTKSVDSNIPIYNNDFFNNLDKEYEDILNDY